MSRKVRLLAFEAFSCRRREIGGKDVLCIRMKNKVERIATGQLTLKIILQAPWSTNMCYLHRNLQTNACRGPTQLPRLDRMLAYAAG